MKVYVSKSGVNCGPCSLINMIGLKGNKKLENKLSELGRMKPFYASDYTSFLIWGKKYNVNFLVYTSSKKLNDTMFELMFFYEKTPKHLQNIYKKQANARIAKINKRFAPKIKILKNPVKKLNELLNKGHKIAVLVSDFYLKEKRSPVPHWIVCFKKSGNNYYFMDSARGLTILSKESLSKGFKINKKQGFYPQLVAYKAKV